MPRNEGAHSLGQTTERQGVDRPPAPDTRTTQAVRQDEERTITRTKPAKTSAAAAFALVFGLSALLSVLTVILAPLGLVLAVVGIILGVVGMKMAKRTGVTGKGVAVAGLVMAVIALLLAIIAAIGVTTVLNDDAAVTRLEDQVGKLRDSLPSDVEVPQP